MVESRINPNISFFLALMHSPYISHTNIINGHALYNALLQWKIVCPNDINKVSFGIPQNKPISLKGSNKYKIGVHEEPKNEKYKRNNSESILDNLKDGYNSFRDIRRLENIFSNQNIDYSPIPFEVVRTKHRDYIIHKIDYFIFYIIWKNEIPNEILTNKEFSIGMRRNDGYGFTRIEKIYNTNMNDILLGLDEKDKFSAMNGISGIYNHQKYGFGEYIVDYSRNENKLIKLITPLCLRSTIQKTTQYGTLPSFFKPNKYEKINYHLWDKGTRHTLECINSGKVFELQEDL